MTDEHFDIAKWHDGEIAHHRHANRVIFTAASAAFALAASIVAYIIATNVDFNGIDDFIGAIVLAPLLGTAAAIAAFLVSDAILGSRPNKMLNDVKVGYQSIALIRSLHACTERILRLNPPAAVAEEVAQVRYATNQVVDSLISLARMLPREDLTKSAPYRWLSSMSKELSRVESELEEARLQTYTTALPALKLDRSREAIQAERVFVNDVMARTTDSLGLIQHDNNFWANDGPTMSKPMTDVNGKENIAYEPR